MSQTTIKQLFGHKAFIKYAATGASVMVLELGLLYWLVGINGWWYLWGSSLSFFVGLVASFFLRKIIVFKNYDWLDLPRQLFFYSLVWLIDLVINAALMYLIVDWARVGYIVSQLISNLFLGIFGFVFNKLVTFKKHPAAQARLQHHQLMEEIKK